jgi:hypothetical protein
MSLKFRTNNSVNRSWISGKKLFGLFLFLGTACMSSAVLAKTDSELRKRLEILEARLLELEGRLESKGEQGERNAGGTNHGIGKEKFHDGGISQQRSSAPHAQTDNKFKKKPEAVGARAPNVEGPAAGTGWQSVEGGSHGFDRKKFHGGVTLKQDAFFGFQTILDAEYEVLDNIDFTFYSWLWTSPNFGRSRVVSGPNGTQVDAGGNGLWTEVGMGLNFHFLDHALSINPQIGMLNGALLSSRIIGRGIRAAEGVVPSMTVNYNDDHFIGQAYLAYYMAIRDERARDFIHNWVSLGVKPALFNFKNIPVSSVGVHWEHLRFHKDRIEGNTGTVYNWIGPYIEFALPMSLALRFSAGADLKGDVSKEFYQASIKLHF